MDTLHAYFNNLAVASCETHKHLGLLSAKRLAFDGHVEEMLRSWRYHRWYVAGTQPLVCSVYCFLSCTFAVVIKKKNIVKDTSVTYC